jgi:hypothetical protein
MDEDAISINQTAFLLSDLANVPKNVATLAVARSFKYAQLIQQLK